MTVAGRRGGQQYNVLADLNSFPRIPVNEGDLSTAGIITAVAPGQASLAGAVQGGIAGHGAPLRRQHLTALGSWPTTAAAAAQAPVPTSASAEAERGDQHPGVRIVLAILVSVGQPDSAVRADNELAGHLPR